MNQNGPSFPLRRSPKRNLFAHVVESLGIRIVKGELNPSEPFPKEADPGVEFGASRSVIRKAVKSLAARPDRVPDPHRYSRARADPLEPATPRS